MKYPLPIGLKAVTFSILSLFFVSPMLGASKKEKKIPSDTLKSEVFGGLKWRSIGPAFASGRIADFAVNPANTSEYYVAVASGHIWKTTNNGTTFSPVFDNNGVYAIGCLAMDPNNSKVVWAGTGENNHQRALGYGNGVYKTEDGGKSWKNLGLKESRQIGMIQIDPRNSDIVFVAAEGSVWGPGTERGLYKTADGGKNWEKVLNISENTGVNNVVFDPRDPDIMYATSEQRRRHIFTKIGGGPETAFYKSVDAGKTWNKITNGLPGADMGGMGIAIPKLNPDIIYLIIEAADNAGGFFRSIDRGASFEKMSDYTSLGQYYNEIYCDPVDPNTVYSVETVSKVTHDGGKTWNDLGLNNRHVDDHAFWIEPSDTKHWMIGGDGGIYETFDGGANFIHKTNLPVTQFYRVNVDNSEPFYWVFGGTQDNNSFGGPSRNTNSGGVTSAEWLVTLGGDGFWQAIEPGNTDITYSAYQYGNIYRYDKKSNESVKIKPEPRKDELHYRWNWDAPFILSTHKPTRLYMGANKLFKSDDRGQSWEVISEDLTRNEDRNQFKVMGKYWPSGAVMKDVSTSQWGTIVALAESPLKEGLVYVGTDDGLIQVTEDDGKNWRKIDQFPGVPAYTFVSDIFPSTIDENVVFASFNNIQNDDFTAYIFKSTDKGNSWTSISSNLPKETIHTVAQDFVNQDLLFAGTEFSFYFSADGGKLWTKLMAGMPDVAVRDLAIQQRENDLVIATFGRGIYILDDYSLLRNITARKLEDEKAILFPVKNALMYVEEGSRYGEGAMPFHAPNPSFGAIFSYYLKEVPETAKQIRLKKEKELFGKSEPIPQPTRDELRKEQEETAAYLIFTIRDEQGNIVRKIHEEAKTGINRVNWKLRYDNESAQTNNEFKPTANQQDGFPALPGKYSVAMEMNQNGLITQLTDPVSFETVILNNSSLNDQNREEMIQFMAKLTDLLRIADGTERFADEMKGRNDNIRQSLHLSNEKIADLIDQTKSIAAQLTEIDFTMNGSPVKASFEEVPPEQVSLNYRLGAILEACYSTLTEPTQTMKMNYEIIGQELPIVLEQLKKIDKILGEIELKMDVMKIPYTTGRLPEMK
ncbi:MAG: glycosyl hydrolase [Bacteroidales bacterium]|nr:glycosyl hydrolase [Bacteroidales bacterium]